MSTRVSELVPMDELIPLIREQLSSGQSVRFSPRGVSMLPMLRQDIDSVILSPIPERLQKYDIAFYQRDNGRYILHRVIEAGDTYTCIGDNQIYPEHGIRHDQTIAVVTAFYRGDKYIPIHNPVYRMYCRIWLAILPVRKLYRRVKDKLRRILNTIKH